MDDHLATRELLSRQLVDTIATDPIGALPIISALQKEIDQHLREAVRAAALTSSWSEIAGAIGVSKQAAHQRFKTYAKSMAEAMKTEHRTMKKARRHGDADHVAQAQARRDDLADDLRTAARAPKSHG